MSRPRLLLVPSFTELEWVIRPQLDQWAEVASFDAPGIGEEPLPSGVSLSTQVPEEEGGPMLKRWREATAERGLAEVDRRGWDSFVVAVDSLGTPAGVRIALQRTEAVEGLAIGHAALSHSREGERPVVNAQIWDALTELLRRDRGAFVKWGLAQATAGVVTEESAERMLQRFPDLELAAGAWELLGNEPEPIGDALASLDIPFLFAKHDGCLMQTEEGFEDAIAAFPEARTASCPRGCTEGPEFGKALRAFCNEVNAGAI